MQKATNISSTFSKYCTGYYGFGFNGKEKDDEVKGNGNSLDFGARIYDSRTGRFLSIDSYFKESPNESNYSFAGNCPIFFIDKKGEYKYPGDKEAEYRKDYPMITKYLEFQIQKDISNSTKIITGLQTVNPNISSESIKLIAGWSHGYTIEFKIKPGEHPYEDESAAGYSVPESPIIHINARYAKRLEKILISNASEKEKQVAFTRFYMTLIHETSHKLSKLGTRINDKTYFVKSKISKDEDGNKAEEAIWGTENYKPFSKPRLENFTPGVEGIKSEKYRQGVTEGIINEAEKTNEGKASLPTVPK